MDSGRFRDAGDLLQTSPALRRYITLVAVTGPLAGLRALFALPESITLPRLLLAVIFLCSSALGERTALRLAHHTDVSVSTAIYVAMLWLLPTAWCGAVAFTAMLCSELTRLRHAEPGRLAGSTFSAGQTALYVSLGAGTFAQLDSASERAEDRLSTRLIWSRREQ